MDNERHALEHRRKRRRVSIVGAGHVAAMIDVFDVLNGLNVAAEKACRSIRSYSMPIEYLKMKDRPIKRNRGGGDYDAKGRRRF